VEAREKTEKVIVQRILRNNLSDTVSELNSPSTPRSHDSPSEFSGTDSDGSVFSEITDDEMGFLDRSTSFYQFEEVSLDD